jgi:hypothetical protein
MAAEFLLNVPRMNPTRLIGNVVIIHTDSGKLTGDGSFDGFGLAKNTAVAITARRPQVRLLHE